MSSIAVPTKFEPWSLHMKLWMPRLEMKRRRQAINASELVWHQFQVYSFNCEWNKNTHVRLDHSRFTYIAILYIDRASIVHSNPIKHCIQRDTFHRQLAKDLQLGFHSMSSTSDATMSNGANELTVSNDAKGTTEHRCYKLCSEAITGALREQFILILSMDDSNEVWWDVGSHMMLSILLSAANTNKHWGIHKGMER